MRYVLRAVENAQNLYIYGSTGIGKTYALLCSVLSFLFKK